MTTTTSLRQQVLQALSIVFLVVLVLGSYKAFSIYQAIAQHANFGPPPETVTTTVVKTMPWPETTSAVATLEAVQGAVLSADEAGSVARIAVDSGTRVKAGEVLVELDTRVEEAQLTGAVVALEKAEKTYQRSLKLRETNAISREEHDQVAATYRVSVAEVESARARLRRKRIVAPFDGTLGIRHVTVGDFVAQGAPVIPLFNLFPLYVDFSLPQHLIHKLHVGQQVSVRVESLPDEIFTAVVSAVDPHVSPSTRTFSVRATVPNKDEKLRPGMFVTAELFFDQRSQALGIPVTSISYAPFGDSVYVVERKKEGDTEMATVRQQFVKLGKKRGDLVQILSGVSEGEEIVTSGLFKLRPGAPIVINNDIVPSSSTAPTPPNT